MTELQRDLIFYIFGRAKNTKESEVTEHTISTIMHDARVKYKCSKSEVENALKTIRNQLREQDV